MKPNLKKDYFWNSTGIFLQNAVSPLLLIFITRLNGIEAAGIFSFAFSLSIIFWTIGLWGGRTYQISDTKNEFTNRDYILVRIFLAITTLAIVAIFSALNGYDEVKRTVLFTLVILKGFEAIADAIYGVMQRNHQLYISGKSLTYKSLLSAAAFITTDYITGNLVYSTIAFLIPNIIFILFYDWPKVSSMERIKITPVMLISELRHYSVILVRCFPIFIILFLTMFSLNIPRYFVDVYRASEIGYFGILAMPVTLVALFISFIMQPSLVRLSKVFAEKDIATFKNIVSRTLAACILLGIGALAVTYVFGISVLKLVFHVSFENYQQPLLILTTGGIIGGVVVILMNVLTVMRRFKAQFLILLFSTLLLFAVTPFIVYKYGLLGAVFAFALTNTVQAIGMLMSYLFSVAAFNSKLR